MGNRQDPNVEPYLAEFALALTAMVATAGYALATGIDLTINGWPHLEKWILGIIFLIASNVAFMRGAALFTFTLVPKRWRPNRQQTENFLMLVVGIFLGTFIGCWLLRTVI